MNPEFIPVYGIYRHFFFVAFSLLAAGAASADPCDQPKTNAEISQCLAIDLQKMYAMHSVAQRHLTAAAPAMHEAEYLNREHIWEKARNARCEVDMRGHDLSAWLRAVAENPRKVICVIRATREHLTQIDNTPITGELAQVSKPSSLVSDYIWISPVTRSTGKWYFEVTFDRDRIVRNKDVAWGNWPAAIWIGCADAKHHNDIGTLLQISPNSVHVPETLGMALDLEHGKLFISRNGLWQGADGGKNGSKMIMQGLSYNCGLESTLPIRSLLDKKLLNVNFGETPFRFSLPLKFRPFQTGI